MTTRDILANVSAVLAQDTRILNASDKELLTSILQHAGRSIAQRPEVADAVREAIERAVGEVVAQRAYGVLGRGVLDKIQDDLNASRWELGSPPTVPPPGDMPRPPGPSPRPPGQVTIGTAGRVVASGHSADRDGVTVLEQPLVLPADAVVLDEFLAPQELKALLNYTLTHQGDFRVSEVLSPGLESSAANFESRRSLVLMDLDQQHPVIVNRIQSCLPQVFERLSMQPFSVSRVEAQITASNDGDFFRCHSDNGHAQIASRQLTFVYFFHREPKAFRGGELRIYQSRRENGGYAATTQWKSITPEQNQIVFFASSLLHEITPVACPSQGFVESRFTVNGWLHR